MRYAKYEKTAVHATLAYISDLAKCRKPYAQQPCASRYKYNSRPPTPQRWWIVRSDPVHWPARSLDLSCMDFFFWSHMKSWVCEKPFPLVGVIIARKSVAARWKRDLQEASRT
ncbi:hypothetical protein TNCV_3487921 [Trichonephila clavipes]|nr:hypothetical protein TNCV_3487921 [Trichonephila clavipes]